MPNCAPGCCPRAPRIDPAELVELGERYARATGYPIQYQWTLLEGINDSDEEMDGIVRLLTGKYAIMNLIPYNTIEGVGFRRPAPERAAAMAHEPAPARHPDQAAQFGRAGHRRRLRTATGAVNSVHRSKRRSSDFTAPERGSFPSGRIGHREMTPIP